MSFLYKTKGEADFFDVHDSYVVITDTNKTITGTALNVGHNNKITKNLPSCTEYWVSYDFYTYGTQKECGSWFWHVVSLNENSKSRPTTALIGGSDDSYFTFGGSGVDGHPGINHVLIHFSTADGTAELWLNGVYINKVTYSWLKGLKVTTIAFSCTGSDDRYPQRANALSNFTISDTKIDESDIWYNPVLSSNGNWGVDDFAVKGSNAVTTPYHVFDSSCNSYANCINNGEYLDIFIKDPVSLKTIILLSNDADPPSDGVVQSSSDGVTYTDIATFKCSDKTPTVVSLNSGLCSYYRILSKNTVGGENRDFSNINLIGTRKTYIPIFVNFDTSRAVQTITTVNADTNRAVAAHIEAFDISADMERVVYRTELIKTDTGRTVQATTTVEADAARKTVLPFAISVDTRRQFGTSFSIGVDTGRTVQASTAVNADISRAVEKTVTASFDATRAVQVPFAISADTARKVIVAVKLDTDTLRTVERTETVNGDALRYLVFDMDTLLIPANQPPAQGEFTPFPANPPKAAKQGIISMTLELATGTLSDTLNFETFGTDFTPKRAIRGTFLDFPYEYRVEQVANTGGRQKVTSMSYIDRLLYVPLKFYVDGDGGNKFVGSVERSSFAGGVGGNDLAEGGGGNDFADGGGGSDFESLAKSLAKHLGYACETHMENIYLKTNYSGMTVTYSAVMSGAFGWLSDLPWRQVNVYIKGGKMCFVQRGQEPSVYDITDLHHDEPTIVQKVFRSRFSANNKTPEPNKFKPAKKKGGSIHTKGYTGRVEYPNGDYTEYLNGQPIESERSTESGTVFTRWEYNGNDKLISQDSYMNPRKADANRTETHTRFYYYTPVIGGSQFTITETRTSTTEYDRKTGKSHTTETVNYTENGKDSTTSTTIRDGDMVVSNGPVGMNTGSEYAFNQQNIIMTGGKTKWFDDDDNEIKDEADISFSSLPVSEAPNSGVQLSTLVAEINSHDRCIEETVEMNIIEAVKDGVPSLTHVINFGERIKYNGNEYNLERNTVTRTAREIKQNIVMIRWFDLSEGVKG